MPTPFHRQQHLNLRALLGFGPNNTTQHNSRNDFRLTRTKGTKSKSMPEATRKHTETCSKLHCSLRRSRNRRNHRYLVQKRYGSIDVQWSTSCWYHTINSAYLIKPANASASQFSHQHNEGLNIVWYCSGKFFFRNTIPKSFLSCRSPERTRNASKTFWGI